MEDGVAAKGDSPTGPREEPRPLSHPPQPRGAIRSSLGAADLITIDADARMIAASDRLRAPLEP
jgi:hypothetical protein